MYAQSLKADENNSNGWPLELFMRMAVSDYVRQMSKYGTYSHQLTQKAAYELCNVGFTIISNLGVQGRTDISLAGFGSFRRIILGHFE